LYLNRYQGKQIMVILESSILTDNETQDLYFVDPRSNRVVYLPANWVNEFVDHDEESGNRQTYCWYGNDDTLSYQGRSSKEMLTTDSQAWFDLAILEAMRRVSREDAEAIDPELFSLMNAYNIGEAI